MEGTERVWKGEERENLAPKGFCLASSLVCIYDGIVGW